VPVAHTCNPSYLGGRDQEDQGLRPARANSSLRPYRGKPFTKKKIGLVGVAQGEGPEFIPHNLKKKKKKKKIYIYI
jgi:hypothetical protein